MKDKHQNNIPDQLLLKYLERKTTKEEKKTVENWLTDIDNQHHFSQLKKLWETVNQGDEFDLINVEEDWQKVKKRIEHVDKKRETSKLSPAFTMLARVAAVIVLMIAVGFLINYFISGPEMIILRTGQNQDMVTLSDGSNIYLNEFAELSYPEKFSGKTRTVHMKGEAYFEIAENKHKPFKVHTSNNASVEVLGTSFNIKTDTNSKLVTVNVTSGKVAFYETGQEENKVILAKNEKAVKQGSFIKKSEKEDLNFLSWKTGVLVFRNTPLEEVTKALTGYYNQSIVISDSLVQDLTFTSTIDNQPLLTVLDEIILVFNLEYVEKNDTIYLSQNQVLTP